MTKRWIAVIALVCGCHKASSEHGKLDEPAAPTSTAALDALWAKEPAGATVGVVVSPRGLAMLEHAWKDVHGFLKTFPAFAPAEHEMSAALAEVGLTTDLTLASVGLAPGKGLAVFYSAARGHGVMFLPVADRDRFLRAAKGTKGSDGDHLDDLTCKPLDGWYTCTDDPSMLATLGKGDLRHRLDAVKARGEIEVVTTAPVQVAAVAQLARGAVVARGVISGVPAAVRQRLGSPVKPHVDLDHASGFAVVNLAPLLADAPPAPILDGVTLADVAHSIAGPLTLTTTAGAFGLAMRVPLDDTAPVKKLVEHCTDLQPLAMLGATVDAGACHIPFAQLGLTYDVRVDGKQLRIDMTGGGTATHARASAFGKQLAAGAWQLAFWGHGTLLAPSGLPFPSLGAIPPEAELGVRALVMMSELGLGVTTEGDRVRVVAGVRTAWANPDDVIGKLRAVSSADILSGKGGERGKAIAAAAPHAPFAADYQAGIGGLMVPAAAVGVVAAIAIPAFVKYQERSALADGSFTTGSAALTRIVVRKYAFEAYPQWSAHNPNQACPGSLAELDNYVDGIVTPDPWGHPYQMACGANLPPGAKGLAVWSVGPDGRSGTADDVTSWK